MQRLKPVIGFLIITLLLGNGFAAEKKKWYDVYFTDPGGSSSALRYNNPESGLLRLIRNARSSFCGAFYELSSPPVITELMAVQKRGIDVKIVIDDGNSGGAEINRLTRAGIPVVTDGRRGLMHNKFAVVDGDKVWTGSYNVTDNGSKKNNNNAILIHSRDLAGIYMDEFTEMFRDRIFGNRKEQGPFANFMKKYHVRIDGTDINAYFSPEDNVERIILKRLMKARHSIHFMAFSFTSDRLGEAMIKKSREGVRVSGLFEKKGSDTRYSEYMKMKIEGLQVRLDRNRYAMHHKVIIIDKRVLITGSYNFSENARMKNDENIIIIDNAEIAAQYLDEFYRLY